MRNQLLRAALLGAALAGALPAQTIIKGEYGELLGHALCVHDIDGDGKPEIIATAPRHTSVGYTYRGRALIIPGGAITDEGRRASWVGRKPGSQLGSSLAIGDVDGDGKPDMVLGARAEHRAAGAVHVIGNGGIMGGGDLARGAGLTALLGASKGGGLGRAVAAADLDGDGIAEVIAGEPTADVGTSPDAGRVLIFKGRKQWPGPQVQIGPELEPDLVLVGREREGLGTFLFTADVNGDGTMDLIATSPYTRNADRPYSGSAVVIHGKKGLLAKPRTLVLGKDEPGLIVMGQGSGQLGSAACVLDLDRDEKPELVLGAPMRGYRENKKNGALMIVPGTTRSLVVNYARGSFPPALRGAVAGELLGSSLCAAALSGKKSLDLLVGTPGAGRVLLFEDPKGLKLGEPTKAFVATGAATGSYGSQIAVGDVDGDGKAEVVITAPKQNLILVEER